MQSATAAVANVVLNQAINHTRAAAVELCATAIGSGIIEPNHAAFNGSSGVPNVCPCSVPRDVLLNDAVANAGSGVETKDAAAYEELW
jgi:hypothetical protein